MCSLYHHEIAINGPGIAVRTSHLDGPEVVVWPVQRLRAAWKQWGSSPGRWRSSVLESSEWYCGLVGESPSSHGKSALEELCHGASPPPGALGAATGGHDQSGAFHPRLEHPSAAQKRNPWREAFPLTLGLIQVSDLHLVEVEPCTSVSNARCRCEAGFTCTDQDGQTGNCRDCEMIPQLLPPSNVVGIRNNQTGTSSEHSRTSSSAGRCQPPHCDTPGSPVSQAGNATHHTTADTSKHLAAILCPMVVIGILAVIILLCIRRPGDEACFKQALKFCNKGVREASPNKTKEPTYQHHTRQPQPSVKHQTVDPPPLTAANMGPVHVHNAGTVIFSLLNQFTGMGGGTEERGQKERDEEGEGCPAHPTPSPNIHLSQEERNGEMDCVFFPSQEQGKDSHISKEEVLLGEGD